MESTTSKCRNESLNMSKSPLNKAQFYKAGYRKQNPICHKDRT